ncbi:Thionin-like protein [Actinidia chinensis var. chinensis]|uniref:Thionin-like protein n=1 Tax=Actinidia chinensis var. chinensis TaxID=1590841 RepID=A0A2R6QZT5_ACTCC|nr:Thionin-like protein [Actinidia chinensis var. chinensis]
MFFGKREMKGGVLRAVVFLFMVCGMVVGQPTTTFKECYVGCFILCIIVPGNSAFECAVQCLKTCIFPKSPQAFHVDNHNFCKLGCAAALCSNISTKQNPGGEKVESCVGSCSEECTKN